MASLTHKLQKLAERRAAGKRAVVNVAGVDYQFVAVRWGGVSPIVVLKLGDYQIAHAAAEWKRLGAQLP